MKYFLVSFMLCFSGIVSAQDSIIAKVQAPKIVAKLAYGSRYNRDTISIQFLKVVTDSRCPKNVQCVWAGKAEVLIAVFKEGQLIEQKIVAIPPFANLQNRLNIIFCSETLSIEGFDLLPYPVAGTKTKDEDYVLQLQIKG